MANLNEISKQIDSLQPELCKIRRDFHKYPESGWTEFRTISKICEHLSSYGYSLKFGEEIFNKDYMLGLPSDNILKLNEERALKQGALEKYIEKMSGGYTGVAAILDTNIPGPTLALRFDVDSNEGLEAHSLEHRPFKEGFVSVNDGCMHCCGHDGHAAIGIGTAKILSSIKDSLCGKIILIFQPAEEGVRGAYSMANSKLLDDVDYFLSGHIGMSAKNIGEVCCNVGGFLATSKFDISFKGRNSHAAASPEKGKNALLGAACTALNLHTLCQDSRGVSRVNVGVLNAGTGRNVVPDNADLKIEIRGENNEIHDYLKVRTKEVVQGAAMMYELKHNMTLAGMAVNANSDSDLCKIVKDELKSIPDVTKVIDSLDLAGSEDASHMMKKVQEHGGKAAYLMFGTKRTADHHNNYFDFDEDVLKIAVKTYVSCAIHLNKK